MNLFYTPDINSDVYTLDEAESKHCVKVLRKKVGDILNLIDGVGGFYTVEIIETSNKSCTVKVVEKQQEYGKRDTKLHIAVAPTKNIDRFEWFLEKATEIGIDKITPLLCDNSERTVIKFDRLEKVVISAMKQSYKAYMPIINPLTNFSEFVKTINDETLFIAHCDQGEKIHINNALSENRSTTILIGPEGDFSKEEIKLAISNNFLPISLSNSRLRTETAALVACNAFNLFNRL